MRTSNKQSDASIAMLESYLGRLRGGSIDIGEFSNWFMNARWEARMAADSAAVRLGWSIQNIFYQYNDFPNLISPVWVIDEISSRLEDYYCQVTRSSAVVTSSSNESTILAPLVGSEDLVREHPGLLRIIRTNLDPRPLTLPPMGAAR